MFDQSNISIGRKNIRPFNTQNWNNYLILYIDSFRNALRAAGSLLKKFWLMYFVISLSEAKQHK